MLNVTINVFEFSLILGYHKTSSAQLSQHVAISNSGSRAVECNPGQVVHTYRYQLTVMLGGWGLAAGLVKSDVAFWYIWIQKFPEDAIFAKKKMRSLFEIRSYLENSTGKRSIAMLPYITTNSLSRKVLVLIATKFLSVNGSYSLPEPHKLYTDDANKGRRCQNMVASNPYSS